MMTASPFRHFATGTCLSHHGIPWSMAVIYVLHKQLATRRVNGECRSKIVSHGDMKLLLMTEAEVRLYVCHAPMIFCSLTVVLSEGIAILVVIAKWGHLQFNKSGFLWLSIIPLSLQVVAHYGDLYEKSLIYQIKFTLAKYASSSYSGRPKSWFISLRGFH